MAVKPASGVTPATQSSTTTLGHSGPHRPRPPVVVNSDLWRKWMKTHEDRFHSDGHGKYLEILVDRPYAEDFLEKSVPVTVGTRIAAVEYSGETTASPVSVRVMIKQRPGYDPHNGDWFYGLYKADGTVVAAGQIARCKGCHKSVREWDFVFGNADDAP